MEVKVIEPVSGGSESSPLEVVARGESIVQERIKTEVEKVKAELSGTSALLAATLGVLISVGLTYWQKLPITGDYRYLWAVLVGLIAGGTLGERVMLVGFGVLVGVHFNAP